MFQPFYLTTINLIACAAVALSTGGAEERPAEEPKQPPRPSP